MAVQRPEEQHVASAQFTPSLTAFWLKASMTLTDRRLIGTVPNVTLGLIPVGSRKVNQPLKTISHAEVDTRVSVARMFFGAVFVLMGLASLGSSLLVALVLLIVGVVIMANGIRAELKIFGNAGVVSTSARAAFTEKANLEEFASRVNNATSAIA